MPTIPVAFEAQFKALGSAARQRILRYVWERERPATVIARAFDMTQPAVSQHLQILLKAGLIELRQEGTRRYYQTSATRVAALRDFLDSFWDERLARLKRAAEAESGRRRARRRSRR